MLFHFRFPKKTNKKNIFSSHLLQLEHGDLVRVDACAREARELVRWNYSKTSIFLKFVHQNLTKGPAWCAPGCLPSSSLVSWLLWSSWPTQPSCNTPVAFQHPHQTNPWQYCNKPMLRCLSNCTLIYFLQATVLVCWGLFLLLKSCVLSLFHPTTSNDLMWLLLWTALLKTYL